MIISIDLGSDSSKCVVFLPDSIICFQDANHFSSTLSAEFDRLTRAMHIITNHVGCGTNRCSQLIISTSWPSWVALDSKYQPVEYFRFDDGRYAQPKAVNPTEFPASCQLEYRKECVRQSGISATSFVPLGTFLNSKLTGTQPLIDQMIWRYGRSENPSTQSIGFAMPHDKVGEILEIDCVPKMFHGSQLLLGTGDTIAAKHASESLFGSRHHCEIGTTPIMVSGDLAAGDIAVAGSMPNFIKSAAELLLQNASQDRSYFNKILDKFEVLDRSITPIRYSIDVDEYGVTDLSSGKVTIEPEHINIGNLTLFNHCLKFLAAEVGKVFCNQRISVGGSIACSSIFQKYLSLQKVNVLGGNQYMTAIGGLLFAGVTAASLKSSNLNILEKPQ